MRSNTLTSSLTFAQAPASTSAGVPRVASAPLDADATIRRALLARLAGQAWWDARTSNVFVDNGTVIYQGLVKDARSRRAARGIALELAGVREVWDARVPHREWQVMA